MGWKVLRGVKMQESYAVENSTARLGSFAKCIFRLPLCSGVRAISPGAPTRSSGVYCPNEEGTCCNKWIKQKPGTSSGLVRLFRPWMNPATPQQVSIAASAGGGSAQLMPRMKTGTLAILSRVTKAARVSYLHPSAGAAFCPCSGPLLRRAPFSQPSNRAISPANPIQD
jgi:hypothetical protein